MGGILSNDGGRKCVFHEKINISILKFALIYYKIIGYDFVATGIAHKKGSIVWKT